MKKILFIILVLPFFVNAQSIDSIVKLKIDAAIRSVPSQPVFDFPTAIKAWAAVNMIPLTVKKKTTNQSTYFFMDTLTAPLNGTIQYEITVSAVNAVGHGAGSKRLIIISNINGVYWVEADITEAYQTGNVLKGTAVSLWVGTGASPYISPISQGVPIVCTPGNNGVLNWTETVLKTDL